LAGNEWKKQETIWWAPFNQPKHLARGIQCHERENISETVSHLPVPKKPVTLRLDHDVLVWFRTLGRGYQTRINAVLRSYVQATRHG